MSRLILNFTCGRHDPHRTIAFNQWCLPAQIYNWLQLPLSPSQQGPLHSITTVTMGSRALRKLQREQLEKQLAASQSEQDDVESEEEDEPVIVSKPRNAFDMLEGMGDEDEESDQDKDIITSQPSEPTPPPSSSKPKKKKKKSKKKQNAKSETPALTESKDVSEDEIDKALKELSLKSGNPVEKDAQPAQDAWEQSATTYLAIDQKNLDPVNEMRGLFGSTLR